MRGLPLTIGTIHFVGIGGIGMSGIAEILHNLGYRVQGSDVSENPNVARLRDIGITVHVGHGETNLGEAQVVVVSSAIPRDNPEVSAARAKLIPVVRRSEMLAELMRLKWSVAVGGTHGKTTTTSLIAAILDQTGLDPTVINGGILNAYGSNARLGAGDWMVVEADESDGTFTKLPATIAVVTNIDPEHLDFYGDFDALRAAFVSFVQNIPFYGFAALCIDHGEVQAMIPKVSDRKLLTYGMTPQADIRGVNVTSGAGIVSFDVVFTPRASENPRTLEGLSLPMLGGHNVQNALAAITVAQEMGIGDEAIREALGAFKGVKRRFTKVGVSGGITVIDDYGHHPVEIAAVLQGAREAADGRIIAVVQPHRYSRLKALFEEFCTCFNDADAVVVADVYPAGETPIIGMDRDRLIEGLRGHGHRNVIALDSPDSLPAVIHAIAGPGDLVVCLGAGSITNWAHDLPSALDACSSSSNGGNGDGTTSKVGGS
jgi:UDP-N-acetylmuramate--alanine ligase